METIQGHHWQDRVCQCTRAFFISDFGTSNESFLYIRNVTVLFDYYRFQGITLHQVVAKQPKETTKTNFECQPVQEEPISNCSIEMCKSSQL